MGLASKLGTKPAVSQPSAPPYQGDTQAQFGASPYGMPPPAQWGQQPPQYGQLAGNQQPGRYGQLPPGQYGGSASQYGQGQGQHVYGQNTAIPQPGFNQLANFGQPQSNQHPGVFGPPSTGTNTNNSGQQTTSAQLPSNQGGHVGFSNTPAVGSALGSAGFDIGTIKQKLQQLVNENHLQAFYPPQRIDQVSQFVSGRNVTGLGARWGLPKEVTLDLVGLALYDIVIFVDDSGSMAFEEGGERIEDMKAVLGRTADAATLFDTDGIVVRFMNGAIEGNGIHSEAEAVALVQQLKFSGTTPLGTSLDRKVLQPMVLSQARSNSMQKPVLVICITDGEPTGEPKDTVRQIVLGAKNYLQNTPYGAGAVAFQFAQVGKDGGATRFLSSLDTDPIIGGMIDCTSYYEQEQEEYARKGINLDPSLYLVKLMVGGIDRSYDEGDEG